MADKLKGKPGFAGWRHAVWVFIKAQLSSLRGKSHRFLGDHFAG